MNASQRTLKGKNRHNFILKDGKRIDTTPHGMKVDVNIGFVNSPLPGSIHHTGPGTCDRAAHGIK